LNGGVTCLRSSCVILGVHEDSRNHNRLGKTPRQWANIKIGFSFMSVRLEHDYDDDKNSFLDGFNFL